MSNKKNTYSDHVFKVIASDSGLVLYVKGDTIALGPEVAGSKAHLWRLNLENEGVYSVENGLYIQVDGTLGSSPQAWDLKDIGGGSYNIETQELTQAVSGEAASITHAAFQGQAFKIVQA